MSSPDNAHRLGRRRSGVGGWGRLPIQHHKEPAPESASLQTRQAIPESRKILELLGCSCWEGHMPPLSYVLGVPKIPLSEEEAAWRLSFPDHLSLPLTDRKSCFSSNPRLTAGTGPRAEKAPYRQTEGKFQILVPGASLVVSDALPTEN